MTRDRYQARLRRCPACGIDEGHATRLRMVTPHRLFLAVVTALGSGRVESLADLLPTFNQQHGVTVA